MEEENEPGHVARERARKLIEALNEEGKPKVVSGLLQAILYAKANAIDEAAERHPVAIEYKEIAIIGITVEQLGELGKKGWKPCSELRRAGDRPNHEGWVIPNPAGLYVGLLWREVPEKA